MTTVETRTVGPRLVLRERDFWTLGQVAKRAGCTRNVALVLAVDAVDALPDEELRRRRSAELRRRREDGDVRGAPVRRDARGARESFDDRGLRLSPQNHAYVRRQAGFVDATPSDLLAVGTQLVRELSEDELLRRVVGLRHSRGAVA